jgi:hypothetical protein
VALTPEIEAAVLRIYRANPKRFSPFKTAKSEGISIAEVNSVIAKNRHELASGAEHSNGAGRPDLQEYIVATRRAIDSGWDNQDIGVARARSLFASGTHTMATHRDGAWLHLCLFPLAKPIPARPNYFATGAA